MPRMVLWLALALLVGAWIVDMLTPQALVAAILLTIPVALASVFLETRFTWFVVALAIVADIVAGWYNGAHEGSHWDSITIANRTLAAFSIVLVGFLGNIAQSAAKRSGQLAARQRQAEKSEELRRAFERIRSSLNRDLVARAIVREAVVTLGADAAMLYGVEGLSFADVWYAFEAGNTDAAVHRERPAPALSQAMLRSVERRQSSTLSPNEPIARLCLDALRADHARVVPLFDAYSPRAVLVLIARSPDTLDTEADPWTESFGEQAGIAMAQAVLFVELAEKNEELAQANRSLEDRGDVIRDIVYALSHDLRTPLGAAAMTLQQALDGKYGPMPESYREILHRSVESNNELRRLAETLLLVAKYESGEQSTARAAVRLGAVARSVVDELEPLWHPKGIRMRVGDDELAIAAGDEGELRRAVMNLVANAIAWTPEGGTIAVNVSRDGGAVTASVEDDGYGVPATERGLLFERLPVRPISGSGSGSGLGLYIVRRIAEGHGGSVTYQPREPRGSKFTVTLPAYSTPASVA
jgi:signal transduction histidine kinase